MVSLGKKRGVYVGEVTASERGWVELELVADTSVKAGDGVVFDAGENRDQEQGARIWEVKGTRLLFHTVSRSGLGLETYPSGAEGLENR